MMKIHLRLQKHTYFILKTLNSFGTDTPDSIEVKTFTCRETPGFVMSSVNRIVTWVYFQLVNENNIITT